MWSVVTITLLLVLLLVIKSQTYYYYYYYYRYCYCYCYCYRCGSSLSLRRVSDLVAQRWAPDSQSNEMRHLLGAWTFALADGVTLWQRSVAEADDDAPKIAILSQHPQRYMVAAVAPPMRAWRSQLRNAEVCDPTIVNAVHSLLDADQFQWTPDCCHCW